MERNKRNKISKYFLLLLILTAFLVLAMQAFCRTTACAQEMKPPAGTSICKVYGERQGIRVVWKKQDKKTDGYQLRLSTDKSMKTGVKAVLVKDPSKTSKRIRNLKANKTFYVQIRTYRIVDGVKHYSKWSGKKKAKVLSSSAPAAAVLKYVDWASGDKVSVRWTQVSGAEGYVLYRSTSKYSGYEKVAVNKGNENVRAVVTQPKDKGFYYTVKAYKLSGEKKVLGETSNIKKGGKYKESNLGYLFPSGPPESAEEMLLVRVQLC